MCQIFIMVIILLFNLPVFARNANKIYTTYHYDIKTGSISYFDIIDNKNRNYTIGKDNLAAITYGVPIIMPKKGTIFSTIILTYKYWDIIKQTYIITMFGTVTINMISGKIIINKGCFFTNLGSVCISNFPNEYYIFQKKEQKCSLIKMVITNKQKSESRQHITCEFALGKRLLTATLNKKRE